MSAQRPKIPKETVRELRSLLKRIANPEQVDIGVSEEFDLSDYIQNADGTYTHLEHYRQIMRSQRA